VPRWIARLNTEYAVNALPGLTLQANLSHEGRRAVLADNSLALPAWTRIDAGLRYAAARATWTLGIDNVLNKQHFTESPTQYGHVYLFSAAPRTVRLAVNATY
jgi:iron complex outermembrane receptor protein